VSDFDDQMSDAIGGAEDVFGDSATLHLAINNSAVAVTVLMVTAKPRLIPAASEDQEYRELELRISAARYPNPQVLFGGQEGDWFTGLVGETNQQWWVVDLLPENDPTMHRVLLRDKEVPKEYAFGG